MAERRMFAKTIIDSDAFLEMPQSTQNLYFHLSMRADDDGFINNPKRIERMIGASDDDLKILCAKSFIIPFDSGIVVIKHWKIHNYIRNDRYKPTVYTEEVKKLDVKPNGAYTVKRLGIPSDNQNGYQMDTQVRVGEVSIVKESIIRESTVQASPSPLSTDSSDSSTLFGGSDNGKEGIKDTVPPTNGDNGEDMTLYHAIYDPILEKAVSFGNYPKEAKAAKRAVKKVKTKAEGFDILPIDAAKGMVEAFFRLNGAGNAFWAEITPSKFDSGFEQIWVEYKNPKTRGSASRGEMRNAAKSDTCYFDIDK